MLKIKNSLVSVDWLLEHIDVPNLIILDASIPKVVDRTSEASKKQIPKTRFFDIKNDFSDTSGTFPNTFPSALLFQESAQNLGVNSDSVIVIYDDKGIYSSPRAWWLFKAFGHDNVAVLDGGLIEWIAAGHNLEVKQKHTIAKGNFRANLVNDTLCFFDDIVTFSTDTCTHILDARSYERFKGLVPEPRKGLRSGTIPNSKSLPFESLFNDEKMKSVSDLQSIFAKFGHKDDTFVFSCGSGITACVLALGATLSGYENLIVYDGSWTEYGSLT